MILILCPYCMSRIDEQTRVCPTCGEDTTRDAPFERTSAEIVEEPRKRCRFCGASIFALAVICPSCRRRQT